MNHIYSSLALSIVFRVSASSANYVEDAVLESAASPDQGEMGVEAYLVNSFVKFIECHRVLQ